MRPVGEVQPFLMFIVLVYVIFIALQKDEIIVLYSYCQILIMPQLLLNFLLTRGNLA